MAPKPKDKKGAKGAKKTPVTKSSSSGEARDPKTMTFKEREEVCCLPASNLNRLAHG